jgi:hypothetical protein
MHFIAFGLRQAIASGVTRVHLPGDAKCTLRDNPSIAGTLRQPHHMLLRISVADNRRGGVAILGPSDHDVVLSLNFKQRHAALLSGRARRNTTLMTGMVGRLG